jgi:DNA-binding PadR family transcriptional regulator
MKGDHIGEFEEFVLLAAHGLGDEAYGAAVQALLERETNRTVTIGAVYAALDRLEQKGMLHSAVVAGTAVRGGRSRRVFGLTARGTKAIASLRAMRARLYSGDWTRPVRSRP